MTGVPINFCDLPLPEVEVTRVDLSTLPDEFAAWGAPVLTVSPRCMGHSQPHGFVGQDFLRTWRAELDAARAAIVRESTSLPGFREMIDTLRWGDMR